MRTSQTLSFIVNIILIIACNNSSFKQHDSSIPIQAKIDSAILLMYKLYSTCETSILERRNETIDTLAKNVSYLCIPVAVNTPEVYGDTTLITIFFQPEKGYEIEDPKCNFAYSVGFIGSDNDYDFVVFGDNYYSLDVPQLKNENPNLESEFRNKIAKLDCFSDQLARLLNLH